MTTLINWAEIGQTIDRVSETRRVWREEDLRRNLVCKECDGEGKHEREDFRAPYSPYEETLSEELCLDGWHVACKECQGTGAVLCEFCGESAEHVDDGVGTCAHCEQESLDDYRRAV